SPLNLIRSINTEFVGVMPAGDLHVSKLLFGMRTDILKFRHAINYVDCQSESINFILNRQFQWRVYISPFLVATHVNVLMVSSVVGKSMNQPRVSVKIENYWLVDREQSVKVARTQTMWVFVVCL